MATPKQLVEKIAELTGVPLGSVTLHDRNLLVAGLRSEGQRGRGKSVVTFEGAANLLIAVAGSRNVRDSADTVRLYAPLPADEPLTFGEEVRGRTFGDALAALIEAPASGPFKVELLAPWPLAGISFRSNPRRDISYRPAQFDPEMLSERSGAMLKWTSWFTDATVYPIGDLLRG
ncbi:hypothetical protein [Bradyrhizobium sp. LB11.1]|uniref:hypothetical protein n=1 Tax=Bradyrhizobium sp. LB11.1 TaxID=3156326 RepID=UPI003397CAE9